MNSKILYASIGESGHLWVVDDDAVVLDAAQKILAQAIEVRATDFARGWRGKDRYRLLVIDSIVREGVRSTPDAAAWMARNAVTSRCDQNAVVVLYSGDPRKGSWHRAYSKSSSPEGDLAALVALFEATIRCEMSWNDWPQELNRPVNALSRAVHGLENLAVPIRIDEETLQAIAQGKSEGTAGMLGEIWSEYFGKGDKNRLPGYLTPKRKFSQGVRGIEREIQRLLQPLTGLNTIIESSALDRFCEGGKLQSKTIAKELGSKVDKKKLATLSETLTRCKLEGKDVAIVAGSLHSILKAIADAIRSLAAELRNIRDTEQKREEGTR